MRSQLSSNAPSKCFVCSHRRERRQIYEDCLAFVDFSCRALGTSSITASDLGYDRSWLWRSGMYVVVPARDTELIRPAAQLLTASEMRPHRHLRREVTGKEAVLIMPSRVFGDRWEVMGLLDVVL